MTEGTRLDDRDALHAYRAGWRQWFYDALRMAGGPYTFVTLTAKDSSLVKRHNPEFLRAALDRHRSTDLDGIFVFEHSRRGTKRVHCHAIARTDAAVARLIDSWKTAGIGWTDERPGTDLLGLVVYLTKAFGPETVWTATGRIAACLTEVGGGMDTAMAVAAARIGATPAPDTAAGGTVQGVLGGTVGHGNDSSRIS